MPRPASEKLYDEGVPGISEELLPIRSRTVALEALEAQHLKMASRMEGVNSERVFRESINDDSFNMFFWENIVVGESESLEDISSGLMKDSSSTSDSS